VLADAGYDCIGPRARDGAIVYEPLADASELPVGIQAHQAPGAYRLQAQRDARCFAGANGPQAVKPLLFPPEETWWRCSRDEDGRLQFQAVTPQPVRRAAVGRVTWVLEQLEPGDRLGLRGPFGHGWPMHDAEGRDLVVVTGGLGCAPVVAAISYAVARRDRFRRLVILQGVKHAADMIWCDRYDAWARLPDTQVRLAADEPTKAWTGHVGLVTELLEQVRFDPEQALAMVCGPEPMMLASARRLVELGIPPARIWLSLERDFQCGVGHCGHCQMGPYFVCRDGPVFSYERIGWLLGTPGF